MADPLKYGIGMIVQGWVSTTARNTTRTAFIEIFDTKNFGCAWRTNLEKRALNQRNP